MKFFQELYMCIYIQLKRSVIQLLFLILIPLTSYLTDVLYSFIIIISFLFL